MRASSRALVGIMKGYFIDEMSTIIDEEKKISHAVLSKKIEDKIDDDKFFKSKELKLGADVSMKCDRSVRAIHWLTFNSSIRCNLIGLWDR